MGRIRKLVKKKIVMSNGGDSAADPADRDLPDPKSWQFFIEVTGGGQGSYVDGIKGSSQSKIFNQETKCKSPKEFGMGFGRMKTKKDDALKPYIRVPSNTDEKKLIYFIETVWELPRPNLLFSITGSGVGQMALDDDLQKVMSDLIIFAGRSDGWLTTGGWNGGIMQLFGDFASYTGLHTPAESVL